MSGDVDARDFDRAARALEHFDRRAGTVVAPALEASGVAVQQAVRARARRHRKTGKLERFVSLRTTGSGLATEVRVHAGGRVAPIIAGGSRPHDITPVRSRALAMGPRGGSVIGFAAAVHHPGTSADPFVTAGIAASRHEISQNVKAAGDRLVRELATDMTRRTG